MRKKGLGKQLDRTKSKTVGKKPGFYIQILHFIHMISGQTNRPLRYLGLAYWIFFGLILFRSDNSLKCVQLACEIHMLQLVKESIVAQIYEGPKLLTKYLNIDIIESMIEFASKFLMTNTNN